MRRLASIALCAALASLGGCGASAVRPDGGPWVSTVSGSHPLVGRIWARAPGAFVPAATVFDAAARARFVLLGEIEDTADNHRLQARVLKALIDRGRRPAVLLEMLTTADGAALKKWRAAMPKDAATLGPAVKWPDSGWPPWRIYQPIGQVALDADLVVVAANMSDRVIKAIAFRGVASLDAATRRNLELSRPLPPGVDAAMREEVVASHCGMLPARAAGSIAMAQRARDAHMARALLKAGGDDGAVLIAGNGHARIDRGVPMHLRRFAKDTGDKGERGSEPLSVTVSFVEVPSEATHTDAAAIAADNPADYVWFTPRVDNVDPCRKYRAALRKMMRKMGRAAGHKMKPGPKMKAVGPSEAQPSDE